MTASRNILSFTDPKSGTSDVQIKLFTLFEEACTIEFEQSTYNACGGGNSVNASPCQAWTDSFRDGFPAPRTTSALHVDMGDTLGSITEANALWLKATGGEESVVISAVETIDETLVKIIGTNGADRIAEFKRYKKGWNFGVGEKLSPLSTGALSFFLSKYSEFPVEPSIFLSDEGNLILGWEETNGNAIELELGRDRIGYYFERDDSEGEIVLNSSNIEKLIAKIDERLI